MADKYGVGTKHKTNEGCWIEILEKLKGKKMIVRFENGYEVEADYSNIRKGAIKNPYHPSVHGIGYLGVGEYKAQINRKHTPEYIIWSRMLQRCYNDKYRENKPTYKNVVICDDWKNFQSFAKWYNENLPKKDGIKFQLDKDLLQENIENKVYSPDTCVLLPYSVNSFLSNKYTNNTSGYVGVYWDKTKKKWVAKISLFGEDKLKHLGYFSTPELASESYQEARAEQAEKVKSYLRSINYLPEEVIQLVK